MFTGIVEGLGTVLEAERQQNNLRLVLACNFSNELKIDQSLCHNGVCLTVTGCDAKQYSVTAVEETLLKTNIGELKAGDEVNLERCLQMNGRLDGHIVQGHVDQTGTCTAREDRNGSWLFTFSYDPSQGNVTVEKGSVTVNGVSLTVIDSGDGTFSAAIIPYTFEHTNFRRIMPGTKVNLEFDIIGKYVQRLMKRS